MDYPGPDPAELIDVEALNYAYLEHLCSSPGGAAGLPHDLAKRLPAPGSIAMNRLARTPFLLLSLREHDAGYWAGILGDPASADLFGVHDASPGGSGRIITAALAFVWQLARQDAHLARLVCGASPTWCEMLADQPLVELLERCVLRGDLPVLRRIDDQAFWRRLLEAGTSDEETVRKTAHITALQVLLTRPGRTFGRRLDAAACRLPRVPNRVSEPPDDR